MRIRMRGAVAEIVTAALLVAAACAQAQWSEPIQCSDSSKVFTLWQSYDFDASGNVHMCWRNWDDGTPDIYYATNSGGLWTRTKINSAKNNILVITPQDQVIHYFWMNGDRIYEQTKPVSGGSWSSAVRVDANPSGGFIQDAVVDPYGGIYLSWGHLFDSGWTPPSGAYGRYKPPGGSWGPTEFIQGISNDVWPQNLQLQVQGNRIYAGYRLTNYSSGARYKVRENGVWSTERLVTTNAYSCNLALSPTGEMACVYFVSDSTPESGTDWNIYAMLSGDDGVTWGPEVTVRDYGDRRGAALPSTTLAAISTWPGRGATRKARSSTSICDHGSAASGSQWRPYTARPESRRRRFECGTMFSGVPTATTLARTPTARPISNTRT